MRLLSSRSRVLRLAVAAMAAGVAFHAAHALTGLGGRALDEWSTDVVYTAVEMIAVAVCAARAVRRRDDRWPWALVTFGVLVTACGDLVWTLWLDNVANPPFPSIADVFYLAMYPSMYVALMLLIRARLRDAGAAQWLDGAAVGLTLAAVGAGLILPTVLSLNEGHTIHDAVTLAYPLGDLSLLAFVVLAFSLAAWRPDRLWLLLGAGLAMNAVGDLVFVYQSAQSTYVAGGILDTTWPAAMSLIAVAAWQPSRSRTASPVVAPHTIALPLTSAGVALALLVYGTFQSVTVVAVGLAAAALVITTLRGMLTYVENVRILRRAAEDAITDALSGLGNRRRLMGDLEDAIAHADREHPQTLAFFDLNGFKRYNDTFGHAAGDALLARVGSALQAATEHHGRAYRLGGDEFCVLLAGRFSRGDPAVCAAAGALTEKGTGFTVTTSCGVAVVPDDAITTSAVLRLADQRMYAEKGATSRGGQPRTRDVLMQLLNERTPDLHDHVSGVSDLVRGLGRAFSLDSEQLDEMMRAAELHDIGKLAIPDEILDKPGPLTGTEWEFMCQHPAIGERILNVDPALRSVARLVRASHERWDGTGYPDRLAGPQIPLGARIISACDAFEAMTSDRCYQAARSTSEAIAELRRNAGSQFDPDVVDALCARVAEPPARAHDSPAASAGVDGLGVRP